MEQAPFLTAEEEDYILWLVLANFSYEDHYEYKSQKPFMDGMPGRPLPFASVAVLPIHAGGRKEHLPGCYRKGALFLRQQ